MAGSYKHMITGSGKLRNERGLSAQLEHNSGDVNEALEECYGMIWALATLLASHYGWDSPPPRHAVQSIINHAQENYKAGVKAGGRQHGRD